MEIFINKMEGERMTQVIQESVKMLEMLPESEQELASQLIRRLVLAWDPDFTKLTPEEQKEPGSCGAENRQRGICERQ